MGGAARRRTPDVVRAASVRALLVLAFTLISLMVTVFAALTGAWFFLPGVGVTAAGVLGTVWGLLDIAISRQVAAQRDWGSGTSTAWANAASRGGRRGARRGARV